MHEATVPMMNDNAILDQAARCIHNGRLKDAAIIYKALLLKQPEASELHYTLGLVYLELMDFDRALYHIQQVIELEPNNAKSYRRLGDIYSASDETHAALTAYEKARSLNPNDTHNLINLGNTLYCMDRFHEALDTYRSVLDLSHDNIKALNNTGKIYHDMGYLEKATAYYNQCIELDPNYAEAHFNRSVALLAMGDYRNGWPEYEWRFRRNNASQVYPYTLATPRWHGQRYQGERLLVHCEQGLGDVLQFVRYLPLAKKLGGVLILEAHPQLLPLLEQMSCIDELVAFNPKRPPTVFHHHHIPLMSLPGLFHITEENLSKPVPYLLSDTAHQKKWQHLMVTENLKIGLVWAGSNTNPKRNYPLEQIRSWFQIPGIHLFSLQKGGAEDKIKNCSKMESVTCLGHRLNDFKDTAAVLANLDLIISIDTAVAHLAGAMGKPVWVLLPYSADWRWPPHRDISPWYPTAKIFRQPKLGDWQSVTARIVQALPQWRHHQCLSGNINLNRPWEGKKVIPMMVPDVISKDPHRGLRMKQRPNIAQRQGLKKFRRRNHNRTDPTIHRNSRIKNVMLISPIYGGSYEVIRYLYSGFLQAGFNAVFQDNSTAYPAYKKIERGSYEPKSKDQLFGQLIAAIDQQLLVSVEKHKPDLVVVAAQSPIHDETIATLKSKGIACAYWFVEDYRFRPYWAKKAPLYDRFFTIQRGTDFTHQLDALGISNWHYLPTACNPLIHKPWQSSPENRQPFRCQIGFMGAPYRNRIKMFESLTHWDFGLWGEGWDEYEVPTRLKQCIRQGKERVSVADSVKIYCCSDIVVNLHSSPFTDAISVDRDFVNPRTFEVAGCSGFQVCDNRTEMATHFTPDKEIILFNSADELESLIRYWIHRPNLRKEIGRNAQKRAYAEHTYRHRADEIVRIIEL